MLNKVIILLYLTLSISASASELLTNYRFNGLNNIEKQLDMELTKVQYWKEYIKDLDTSFGYLESNNAILTCDKDKSILSLYKKNNNKYKFVKTYNAFTGKIKGDKQKEGDLKTPNGIYKLTKKLSKVDSFYGPLAYVTSYPNIYDKYHNKNGSGIWIHGLPIEQERDDFTKGCIAINNKNIECLDKNINVDSTIVIINKKINENKVSKDKLSSLLAQLYMWRYSWLYNDTNVYLNFYSKSFIRYDKMNYDKFKIYKTRIFKKMEKKKIIFKDINIIPYPNQTDLYQITFKEYYKSRSFVFEGEKILIVRLNKDNNFKILTEK